MEASMMLEEEEEEDSTNGMECDNFDPSDVHEPVIQFDGKSDVNSHIKEEQSDPLSDNIVDANVHEHLIQTGLPASCTIAPSNYDM